MSRKGEERQTHRLVRRSGSRGGTAEQGSHALHVATGGSDDATHVHGPPHDDGEPEQEVEGEDDDQNATGAGVTAWTVGSRTSASGLTSGIL